MSSKRRRSRSISLVLLPPALALSMLPLLSGCGPDDDSDNADTTPAVVGAVFSSAAECKAVHEGNPSDPDYMLHPLLYTPQQCDEAMAAAVAEHATNAPKFNTIAECEAQFGPGSCGQTPIPVTVASELVVTPQPSTVVVEHESSFMPFMTGYMLGSLNSGHYYSTPVYYPAYSFRSSSNVRPLVASGGVGYSRGATSSTIGYVARNTTSLSPVGGPFGSRAVVAPTASGAAPSSSSFRSAVGSSPGFSSRGTSSFGSSVAAPSSRGGFGGMGSSFGGSSSGG